jgi:hypothetical protein
VTYNVAGADVWVLCAGSGASERCLSASFLGLRYALVLIALLYLWAGLHYYLASRTLARDLISGTATAS